MNIFKAIVVEAEKVGGVLASLVRRVEAIEAFLESVTAPPAEPTPVATEPTPVATEPTPVATEPTP